MQTVNYKDYTITKFESKVIEVVKDGNIISPTKPLLRDLAKELDVNIENKNGNPHNTQHLGDLIIRAIKEKQPDQSIQLDKERVESKPIDNKHYDKEYKKNTSHTSFLDKIKQTIRRIQKPTILKIEDLIADYLHRNKYGIFYLDKGERIEKVLAENIVPNKYGVYIIYSVKDLKEEMIYIGKAGTITTKGEFKKQGIKDRLKAVTTNNMQRGKYFQQEVIQKYGFDKLKFVWIVTYDDTRKELPAYSESRLIQLYYDDYHTLPILNRSM